jgi:sugar lactone lactonase YvrE
VSDFYSHSVKTVTTDGAEETVLTVEAKPSGLGWLPDGSLLIVSMKDRKLLRRSRSGEVTEHADLSAYATGHCNDMVVDGQGRAYVGNFGFDLMAGADFKPATLVRVDPDGTVTAVADDMGFPNGSVITPDGRTLIVGESAASRFTAFTIADDGSLTDRRVWAQVTPDPDPAADATPAMPFAPDGCTLDADGMIWVADAYGGRCARVAEGGRIVDEVPAPAGMHFYACMLGGVDGRTLLLCGAPDSAEATRAASNDAVLLTTRAPAPHAGLP